MAAQNQHQRWPFKGGSINTTKKGHKSIQQPTAVIEFLLANGPNFAVVPMDQSHIVYMMATEQVCHKINNKTQRSYNQK